MLSCLQKPSHRSVWTSSTTPVRLARCARIATSLATKPSSASIGCVDCARRAMTASFSTSSTCPRCPSATSTRVSVSYHWWIIMQFLYKISFCTRFVRTNSGIVSFRCLPQQGMSVSPHRSRIEGSWLPVVRPRILSARALVPSSSHTACHVFELPCWILPWRPLLQTCPVSFVLLLFRKEKEHITGPSICSFVPLSRLFQSNVRASTCGRVQQTSHQE